SMHLVFTLPFFSFPASPFGLPLFFFLLLRPPPRPTLFPYTTLFRSGNPMRVPRSISALPPVLTPFEASPKAISERTSYIRNSFRSEEHTSELQSRFDLVCRLLLEKKKKTKKNADERRTAVLASRSRQ